MNETRSRATTALLGAGLVTAFLALDVALGFGPLVVAVRLAWIVALLGFAAAIARGGRTAAVARHAVGPACAAFFLALVASTGGAASGYFGFLPAFPLCMLVLQPDLPSSAITTAAVTLAGGLAMLAASAAPPGPLAQFALMLGTVGFLAARGSALFRRARAQELAAERARAAAIAELAESERRRAEVERLAAIGRIASGVAHEINNPLAYVKANLGWIREELCGGGAPETLEELPEVLDETAEGVARIAQIVSDLREFAREGARRLEPCRPAALVTEALRLARQRGRLDLNVLLDVPPGLPLALATERRVVEALESLVVNAADAAQARAARGDGERAWVRVDAWARADTLSIAVEDSGDGVAADVVPRLFEPFFSTKGPRGTGLGLALSREKVERCGGALVLEPSRGHGARFRLDLPLAAPAVAPEPRAADAARACRG